MNPIKLKVFLMSLTVFALLAAASLNAQQKTETPAAKPPVIKISGVQLVILTSPEKAVLSKTPVNNAGAGGFKVSKLGNYIIKATFAKKVENDIIKELKIDIRFPDGTRKTLNTTPEAGGKSIESEEFEWTEYSKPIYAYLISTKGKISTPAK